MEFCQGNIFFSGEANIRIKQVNCVISQNSMWLRNVLHYSAWPSSCIRANCTPWTLKPIFFSLFYMTDAHCTQSFSSTDSFVVPNTYSDLHRIPAMLEMMAVQSTYQQNLSSFSYNVHLLIILPLSHTFIVTLNFYSSVNFSRIYALLP